MRKINEDKLRRRDDGFEVYLDWCFFTSLAFPWFFVAYAFVA